MYNVYLVIKKGANINHLVIDDVEIENAYRIYILLPPPGSVPPVVTRC